ncbi:MAG TPA: nucleotide exchange factor GrpE [Candidatus Binataceae bacterium]|nr:nucleotide exchange factor GrpE [Candidatus Binataceae bacterium]
MSKRHKHPESEHSADGSAGIPGAEASSDCGAQPSPDGAGAAEGNSFKEQIAGKDREIAELKDKYLRTLAETENIRRRVRQQSEESVRLQREALLHDLLPIVDNLERAVEAARKGAEAGSIVQGVEMVLRSLMDYLRANGVTPVASVGQQFDPKRHEAVDHVASDQHPPNTIVAEFHRGYLIGDRTLRPARVSVAKESTSSPNGRSESESGGAGEVENY